MLANGRNGCLCIPLAKLGGLRAAHIFAILRITPINEQQTT